MRLYKIIIKPISSYSSLLQSDTFFGAFCWSYKYLYGEESLEAFLAENIKEGSQLIFSNAFSSGYLPLPMGCRDEGRNSAVISGKISAKKEYQENKKLKKCSLVARSAFQNIQKGNRKGYSKDLYEEQLHQVGITHNMVGRDTGTVTKSDDGSGNLFVKDETFADKDSSFDVYILTALNQSLILDVMKLMFELGIGASKSTGKGQFEMIPYEDGELLHEEKELQCVDQANGYMALSNFIPANSDPTQGWYKTLAKYGKLDREYSAAQYPYKKPLLFLQAGAVFQTDDIKQYYGKFVEDVAAISSVVINACTIALPMKIPEEVKK